MLAVENYRRTIEQTTRRIALAALFVLPLTLLYARAGAEIAISVIGALFLLRAVAARDTGWLHSKFTLIAVAWWVWQIAVSAAAHGGLGLAVAALRLPLLAVALRAWLLREPENRRRLRLLLTFAVGWIVLECWQQYLFGTNLFGQQRWPDGALTGPFNRPRAGPELILLLFPVLVPIVARRLELPSAWSRFIGVCLAAVGACTVLLIGQRMPSALLVLGLVVTALVLPRFRLAVAGIAIAGIVLLATMPVIAPPAYDKLVVHTTEQLRHFAVSPYGEIWVRAAVIAERNPWRGVGVNGFRRVCNDAAYVQGVPALGVTNQDARAATEACNIHPHNYYLEAADDGGLPLLGLFAGMVIAAISTLAAGLRRKPEPQRVGVLAGAVIAFWPMASTSAFTAMPNAGWIFLLLGLGFATADAARLSRDQAIPEVI